MEVKSLEWEKPVIIPLHQTEEYSHDINEKNDNSSMPFYSMASCFPGRTVQGKPCKNGNHP